MVQEYNVRLRAGATSSILITSCTPVTVGLKSSDCRAVVERFIIVMLLSDHYMY